MESTTEITKIQDELLEKKVTEGQTKKTNFSIDSLLQRKLGSLPTENNSTPRKLKSPRCEIRGDCDPPTVFNIQPIGLDSFMRPPFPPFFNGPLMPFPFGQPHHPVDLFFSRFPAPFRSRPPTTVISDDAEVKEDRRGQWDSKPPYNHIPSFNNSLGLEGISRTTGGTTKTPPVKKYKCDICGKAFSRSNTLVTHKRIHTGEKPFKCEHCGRAFRQPGNLTRHRLTHTTVKPYICSQCGKAFNRASNLHTHMRTHTNYRPFVCPFCGKGFHQKIDMKIHSYTHTGEKPHRCSKCGRGFKQLTHLNYHLRTHSDDKPFNCKVCGKGFNQKGNLQAHILGHTGERPFKCDICHKGFTLASTLNTHKRTHSEVKPFVCHHCGKDFYQKNSLKSHLIASHPYADSQSFL